MTYIRKHLFFTLAAAILLISASIKETKGNAQNAYEPFLFSADMHDGFSIEYKVGTVMSSLFLTGFNYRSTILQLHSEIVSKYYGVSHTSVLQSPANATSSSLIEAKIESESFLENQWQRFMAASLKVKILLAVLFYLVLSVLILFVSILIHRQYKTRQRQKTKQIKDQYQEQLANFLFDDEVESIQFSGINKKINRQLLIDEIMDLHNNLYGEVAGKLKDLYFNLGLHKDSLNSVYRGRWDRKAKGFGELAQMDVKDANEKIRKFVSSKNPILRMQAQVALVKLSEENPLDFLHHMELELSHWEQINIYDTLTFHQISIESFEEWLDSKNASVVVFALRMIGHFKHVHSGEKVRELLFSEKPDIALAAVEALKELELAEYIEDIKILYRSETLKLVNILETQRKNKDEKDIKSLDDINPRRIRYEIMLALQPIATENEIPFLEDVLLDNENSFKIRILAIAVLSGIKPAGETKLNELLNSGNELIKKMIINVKQNQES